MHSDDGWEFPGYMKEPVPDVTPYHIDSDVSRVTAWSTACIPFEPKGWRRDFRNDLRKAIARLPSRQGKVLSATYRSAISEGADVENLLIYNVFNAKLSRAAKDGLIFERFDEVPPDCPILLSSQALCQYEYRLADDKPMSPEGQGGQVLASVSFELPARIPESPATVWYAAKLAGIVVTRGSYVNKPWGILISIRAPSSSKITCSNIVKPLIDGIASALHFHDGADIDCLGERLGVNLGFRDGTSVKALLQDDTNTLFGETNLLCRHGDNVQWNPRDEYCTYCSIKCQYDLPRTRVEVTARVFDIGQREVV